MKHMIQIIALVVLLMFIGQCTEPETETIPIKIQGTVFDIDTSDPIADAVVRLFSPDSDKVDQTDATGNFLFTLGVDSTIDISLIVSKEGYFSDTTRALAVPERDITLPAIYLSMESSGTPGDTSGTTPTPNPSGVTGPANIALASVSTTEITVIGSGGLDNTNIVFQVLDSSGVSAGKDIPVTFSMGSSPGGGEYISPAILATDKNGQVAANLVSGTRAGVVQVLASVDVGSATISSQAVPITIHGGLPDSAHFGLAPAAWNFPGYGFWGETNIITAYVGDKYGNYCTPGTAVYFTTAGGMIGGSGLTEGGTCSVVLIAAPPLPSHPDSGEGFATITARTADENNEEIETSIVVLFSGSPQIDDVSPASINVPNNGSQTFSFTVSDQNGNPLSKDTVVRVSIQADAAGLLGNDVVTPTGLKLPDTQNKGPNLTEFTFEVVDTGADVVSRPVYLTISVSGPNGSTSVTLTGSSS